MQPTRYVHSPLPWIMAAGLLTAALTVTGCGAGASKNTPEHTPSTPKGQATTPSTPKSQASKSPQSQVPESPREGGTPTIREGKTARIYTSGNELTGESGGTADVTLVKKKAATSLPEPDVGETFRPDKGHQFLCMQFKVKNVDKTGKFDMSAFEFAEWRGKDGERVSAALGHESCESVGMPADEDIASGPAPGPGEHVTGVAVVEVPNDQPGVVEFQDPTGSPPSLFRIRTEPTG